MYILDNDGKRVEADCSLGFLDGSQCVVVESSGGSNKERGIERRNPDYNILLRVIFSRLAASGRRITRVVLDSNKVENLPLAERIAMLADFPYPIELASTDVESFRKSLQREIATMHQDPGAKGEGNSQKRIRVCLDECLSSDQRLAFAGRTELQDPDDELPPGTRETEKEYLSKARVGQGEFRKRLLEKYDGTCPVTGIANPELLIASHIKPWRDCSSRERLDRENGILLSALVDRLFDRSLITFSEEGQVLVSSELSETDRQSCRIGDLSSIRLSDKNRIYMEYHREVFKQAQQ